MKIKNKWPDRADRLQEEGATWNRNPGATSRSHIDLRHVPLFKSPTKLENNECLGFLIPRIGWIIKGKTLASIFKEKIVCINITWKKHLQHQGMVEGREVISASVEVHYLSLLISNLNKKKKLRRTLLKQFLSNSHLAAFFVTHVPLFYPPPLYSWIPLKRIL